VEAPADVYGNVVKEHMAMCWAARGPAPVDSITGLPMHVDHFNRNRRDNRFDNLDYASWLHQKMNIDPVVEHGHRLLLGWLAWYNGGRQRHVPLPASLNLL
jgi:hypothetical protein